MVNGAIGGVFVLLLVKYLAGAEDPNMTCAGMLLSATALSFLTFLPNLPLLLTRVLALCTVVLMFYFFASFFFLVPSLGAEWYRGHESMTAFSFLFGAFCMIPLMSEYSCRLKADCPQRRKQGTAGFFTVPERVQKHLS